MSGTKVQTPHNLVYTEDERRSLAKLLTNLFQLWQLEDSEALSLLGLNPIDHSVLAGYQNSSPLHNDSETLNRAGLLFGIHKRLNILFSRNPECSYAWMKTPNRAFKGCMPVEVIRNEGLSGLHQITEYLDRFCTVEPLAR